MVMNVKSLRSHGPGSPTPPPPPAESPSPVEVVTLRYSTTDAVPFTDILADGSQLFAYPDGPFRFYILDAMGNAPPALDFVFDTFSGPLFASLVGEMKAVDFGAGMMTVGRIAMKYGLPDGSGGSSIYRGTIFSAQAYLQDAEFPLSHTYGPLLQFSCQPTLYDPAFVTSDWYVNRYSRNGGFHEIDSPALTNLTFPANWGSAEEIKQGNLILLPASNIAWGTLSRLTWEITQLGGPTRGMKLYSFNYTINNTHYHGGDVTSIIEKQGETFSSGNAMLYPINDASPALTEDRWASGWMLDDTYTGMLTAPNPYRPFVFIERAFTGYSYMGCSYNVQAKFDGVDFGPAVILQCES